MARFAQHEEGDWNEPTRVVDNCPREFQAKIEEAYGKLMAQIRRCLFGLPCYSELYDCLQRVWNEIVIDCSADVCADADAKTSGNVITFCTDISNNMFYPVESLEALLLHEMIHACGGNEVDAYVITADCYPQEMNEFTRDVQLLMNILCEDAVSGSRSGWLKGRWTVFDNEVGVAYCIKPGTSGNDRLDLDGSLFLIPGWRSTPVSEPCPPLPEKKEEEGDDGW